MAIETIDLTPTFAEATAICIAVIETFAAHDKPTFAQAKAAEDAKLELMRYAAALDNMKKGAAA